MAGLQDISDADLLAMAKAPPPAAPREIRPPNPTAAEFAADDAAIAARGRPDTSAGIALNRPHGIEALSDDQLLSMAGTPKPAKATTPPATAPGDDEPEEPWQSHAYQLGRGAITSALGSPADLGAMIYKAVRPPEYLMHTPELPENYVGGTKWLGNGLDAIQNAWDRARGSPDPEIGHEPKGALQRFLNATGTGVGGVLGPLTAIKGLSKALPAAETGISNVIGEPVLAGPGVEGSKAAGALTNFFQKPTMGTLATEAGMGAVSGAGADIASEVAPGNPLAPLIGGIGLPLLVGVGAQAASGAGRSAKRAVAPFGGTGQRKIAGSVLNESALDPAAVRSSATTIPPIEGQRPTLAQVSRDPGIGALDQAAATVEPGPHIAQRSANNQAIRSAAAAASEGDPAAIRAAVEARQKGLQGAADRGVQRAEAATGETITSATPTGAPKAQAAENLHGDIMAQHAASEAAERAAWAPINEVQGLEFDAKPIKADVKALVDSLPRADRAALPPSLLGIVKDWGGAEPFAELTSLKSAAGSAGRAAARAGDANTARVIGKLENILGKHLDNPSLLGDAEALSIEGQPGIKEAYDNARRVTREQKQQFNTDTETAALFRKTGTGDVKVAPTETVNRFVKPGPGGKESFEALVKALGGPEVLTRAEAGEPTALNHVRDWAMADLQAKPLTTKSLTAWRDKYSGMVDSFPQLRNDLDSIGQAVARQEQTTARRETLTNMVEKNAANTFMEGEPEYALGKLLKSPNLEANDKAIAEFSRFIKRNPEAAEGARRTMVDLLMSAGEKNISDPDLLGKPFLSSPQMTKFYEKNGRVFDALFPNPDQRALVDRIVDSVKMNGPAGVGANATTGPNTANKLAGVERFKKLSGEKYIDAFVSGTALKTLGAIIGGAAGSIAGHFGIAGGAVAGAVEVPKLAKAAYAGPREKVMTLVQDALRDPALARDLMREATPRNNAIVGPRFARYLGGAMVPAKAAAAEDADEE